METVPVRADACREGHPQSADEKSHRIAHMAARRIVEQAAQRRKLSFRRKLLSDGGIAGIEPDDDDRTRSGHRRFFARTVARSASWVGPCERRSGDSV